MTDALPAELVAAYEATLYEVFGERPAVLSVADAAGAHDQWLARNDSHTAVVITAWNPFSRSLDAAANEEANALLRAAIESQNLRCVAARGRHPSGQWSEESLCAFDVPDPLLDEWLIEYRQNAAIRVRLGEQPLLVWHPCFLHGTPGYADHFDVHQLRLRGWTEAAIRKVLGEPDSWASVAHYRNFTGKRMYLTKRVVAAESTALTRRRTGATR